MTLHTHRARTMRRYKPCISITCVHDQWFDDQKHRYSQRHRERQRETERQTPTWREKERQTKTIRKHNEAQRRAKRDGLPDRRTMGSWRDLALYVNNEFGHNLPDAVRVWRAVRDKLEQIQSDKQTR